MITAMADVKATAMITTANTIVAQLTAVPIGKK